jgi:site-specific DNA recombinase
MLYNLIIKLFGSVKPNYGDIYMAIITTLRVSDPSQEDNLSIPAQDRRTSDYVKHKGLGEIDKKFTIVETASQKIRRKFDEVIETIERSKEPVILVVDTVDRITRNFRDMIVLDDLRRVGKLELHFLRENLIVNKDSTSSDIIRWDYAVVAAKTYSLQLSDNVKRSIREKLLRGEWIGKAPIGYINIELEDETKTIVPDPDRAHLIRQCFKLYATGNFSLGTLRRHMKVEGLTNNTNKELPLSQGQIDNILNNPFYYGEMLCKGQLYPHNYQPLISKELYDKVQDIKRGWNKKPFKHNSKKFPYRGMFKCKHCGCMITPEKKKDKYVYYHCTQYHGNHNAPWIKQETITEYIVDLLRGLVVPSEAFTLLVDSLKKEGEDKNRFLKDTLANFEREISKTTNRISVLYEDRLDGRITTDDYDEKSAKYKNDLQYLQKQREKLTTSNTNVFVTAEKVLELANNAHAIFRSSKEDDKKRLLNFLLQNSFMEDEIIDITLRKPFDLIVEANKSGHWLYTVHEVRKCFVEV